MLIPVFLGGYVGEGARCFLRFLFVPIRLSVVEVFVVVVVVVATLPLRSDQVDRAKVGLGTQIAEGPRGREESSTGVSLSNRNGTRRQDVDDGEGGHGAEEIGLFY